MRTIICILLSMVSLLIHGQNVYQLGDIIEIDNEKAIVFELDETGVHGKAMSVKALRGRCQPWNMNKKQLKSLAPILNKEDGEDNTNNIISYAKQEGVLSELAAFVWCKKLGPNWYIPSVKELESFIDFWVGNKEVLDWDDEGEITDSSTGNEDFSRKINHKLLDAGGTIFKNRVYSSTVNEEGKIYVFVYNYKKLNWNFELKSGSDIDEEYTARAFIKF